MPVNYDDYLTEKKLIEACKSQLFPNFEVLVNRPLPESNFPKRYRYDILVPKLRLAIEFDGYLHICLEDYTIVREEILSTLDKHSLLLYQNLDYENFESILDDFLLRSLRPYTDFLHQK